METTTTQFRQGLIIRKSTGTYEVFADDQRIACTLSSALHKKNGKSRQSPNITVGDQVLFTQTGATTGVIHEVLPRETKFARRASTPCPAAYAHEQVIVANIDLAVVVVAAANPPPRWNMVDRYLVTAEASEMSALVCLTKTDLARDAAGNLPAELAERVAEYRAAGYPVVLSSAAGGEGLDELKEALRGRTCVFLGKSGVGKTTLLNALLPGLNRRTGDVSAGRLHRGKHTTTDLEMIPLENGGVIVDTPGVREFGLWEIPTDDLAQFFPEMRPYLGQCRFGLNCAHDEEPGCAVRKAVMEGHISPRRYKSYIKLRYDA